MPKRKKKKGPMRQLLWAPKNRETGGGRSILENVENSGKTQEQKDLKNYLSNNSERVTGDVQHGRTGEFLDSQGRKSFKPTFATPKIKKHIHLVGQQGAVDRQEERGKGGWQKKQRKRVPRPEVQTARYGNWASKGPQPENAKEFGTRARVEILRPGRV